ncbi:hypothetical protein STK_11477 [Sulfurisphaera tokodaii str. 7]|uniref:Uncharacterized protein n=1 Tax=Sulfurisphaera tokodaii (strain DSM 16993 / JCM 10545 / NBRC 100140 / 7) TaxID=273063 RepID=F9VNW3_SULTO|nr:hypothetical protein [Sulfurisphaera tokodaii]BAK54471.1 hypothetical protein STK_11477 [Sulfurisphaera tokodaii str. 7]
MKSALADKTRGKPRLLRRGKVFNLSLKLLIKCGEAHKGGHTEDMCPRTELHIPESPRAKSRGQLLVRDRGNGLKTQPVVYRWTNGAGWVLYAPTSYEVVRMKVVNHKPMNRPKGTLAL